jgi:small-conductance mechanosensitive channel
VLWLAFTAARQIIIRYTSRAKKEEGLGPHALMESLARRSSLLLMLVLAAYAGSLALKLPPKSLPWFTSAAVTVVIIQLAVWAVVVVGYAVNRYQSRNLETAADKVTTIRAVSFIARLMIFAIAGVLILDNIPGVQITALIASLGIGGIAIALAVQNILSDLFASLSIVLDKPFVIGDFIIVDSYLGTVEYIGLKTTRVRSLSGEQLIFSNNDLLTSRIRNYKRMAERRVVFSIGVTYQTSYEVLSQIPSWIKEIIDGQDAARFDRAHFQGYGDFALQFEIVYYVLDADYNRYMDLQQRINLEIYRRFEEAGVSFAYPTQTLYLKNSRPASELEDRGESSVSPERGSG